MRKALAIETSGRVGSVALVEGDAVVCEDSFPHGLQHAAGLIPMIERLCRTRGWVVGDFSELYLSIGPGSFTGLRIGVTLAKTLAMATGVRLVAVPTPSVLVENAPGDARQVIILLDAKRDQIFTSRFHRSLTDDQPEDAPSDARLGLWTEVESAHLDSLSAMLNRSPRPVHLLGEGTPFHRRSIPSDPLVIMTDETCWRARASVVARLGMAMAGEGKFADPMRLAPTYIRRPEAEEKWEAQQPSSKRD